MWRFLYTPKNDPYTNMAIDEAILNCYSQADSPPTFRIYGWTPESISLGYFQKANDVLQIERCLDHGIGFVRRITGGEAIFHGNDLTYSIICSKDDLNLPESVKESFRMISSFLMNAYEKYGVKADFSIEQEKEPYDFPMEWKRRSDFCFATNQDFDIVVEGKKIGGNAQKRRRNIIFQHGSIPLTLDINRIALFLREELTGVEDRVVDLSTEAGRHVSFEDFAEVLKTVFKETFEVSLVEDGLTAQEHAEVDRLLLKKYLVEKWNFSAQYKE